jgi:hypothetical protein
MKIVSMNASTRRQAGDIFLGGDGNDSVTDDYGTFNQD